MPFVFPENPFFPQDTATSVWIHSISHNSSVSLVLLRTAHLHVQLSLCFPFIYLLVACLPRPPPTAVRKVIPLCSLLNTEPKNAWLVKVMLTRYLYNAWKLCWGGGEFSIRREEKKDGQQNERKERRKNRDGRALRSLKQLMLTFSRGDGPMIGLHIVSIALSTEGKNLSQTAPMPVLLCFNGTVLLFWGQWSRPSVFTTVPCYQTLHYDISSNSYTQDLIFR